jgi:hypothetical protein
MASKCPNLGKQVRTMNYDWSDKDEPILFSPPVHKDSYEWNLKQIASAQQYFQTSLLNLWNPQLGAG